MTNTGTRALSLIVLLVCGTVQAWSAPSAVFERPRATEIQIVGRPAVTVTEPMIRLSDIADISSGKLEDDEGIIALRKLEVTKSPLPGEKSLVDASFVLERMKEEGVRLSELRYTFPKSIAVERAYREVSVNELESAVRAFLGQAEPNLQLRRIDTRTPIRVAANAPRVEAIAVEGAKNGQIGVDFQSTDDMRFRLKALVDEWRLVPTARRALLKGESVRGADVELVRKNVSALGRTYLDNISDIVGSTVNRDVGQGESFDRNSVSMPPMILAGSQVTIVYRNGALEASATGIALDSGSMNDEIRIRNDTSRKVVKGRVQDEGLVAVGPNGAGNR